MTSGKTLWAFEPKAQVVFDERLTNIKNDSYRRSRQWIVTYFLTCGDNIVKPALRIKFNKKQEFFFLCLAKILFLVRFACKEVAADSEQLNLRKMAVNRFQEPVLWLDKRLLCHSNYRTRGRCIVGAVVPTYLELIEKFG